MSVQIDVPLAGAPMGNVAQLVEGIVRRGFNVQMFLEHFEVLSAAGGGTAQLRQLALQLAFQGRFTGNTSPLVPAVVRGNHQALSTARGREAAATMVPGSAALAVGPAPMLIPDGWDWVPLVSVAKLESGHTPSRNHADYWDGGVPWIGIRDARDHNFGWIDSTEQTVSKKGLENSSARLLPSGTVCLSRTASVGYVTIMKRPMATSQDFVNWVCGDRLLPEFLMQLLRCEVPILKRFSKGAVHQTIYFPEAKAFHISLPPVAEQKRIVARVNQLMALIDDLEAKQTRKVEAGTRLTKSALEGVAAAEGPEEFGAAWTKVVGNFEVLIDRAEKVAELRAAILQLAVVGRLLDQIGPPTESAPSFGAGTEKGIRINLPPAWRWVTLGQIAELINGDRGKNYPNKAEYVREGVAWINTGHIEPDGTLSLPDMHYISRRKFDSLRSGKVRPGDLVYCLRGATLGKTAIITQFSEGAVASSLVIIRLSPMVDPDFAYRVLTSPLGREQIFRFDNGSAQPNLSASNVKKYWFPLPPLAEQKRIVAKVQQLMKLCDDLEAKLRRAEDRSSKLTEAVVQEMVA